MAYQDLVDRLRAVHAINVTPFREDRSIDYEGLERNVRFMIEGGVEVIVPCGNTGEFYAVTVEEAEAVTRFVAEKVDGRATVLVGVGHDAETAGKMALAAQEAGADAVMVHQPAHPYTNANGLVRYYTHIAGSLRIGVALYVRHPAIDRDVLEPVTAIDNVVAIKYAVNDLPLFASLVHSMENLVAWICGSAEMWAPFFFAAGAEGFTSGLVNIAPEKSLAMLDSLRRGDQQSVMAAWNEVAPLERLRAKHQAGSNVIVMNAVQAEEALFGEDGVVHGLRQHSVVVIMSTLGPEKLRELGNRLEEFEFRVLDAPVTGGAARAEQGDLVVLAGGDEGLLEELQPVLEALGSSIVHCGTSVGDGQAVKMVNQLLVGIHLAAAGEALAFAEALGLNPRAVFETVKQGAANSFMLEHRGETMLSGDFTPRGSKLQVLIKDMGFVVESAKRYGFTASLASSANEIYQRASDLGFGDEEDAGIARMFGRSQTDASEMKD